MEFNENKSLWRGLCWLKSVQFHRLKMNSIIFFLTNCNFKSHFSKKNIIPLFVISYFIFKIRTVEDVTSWGRDWHIASTGTDAVNSVWHHHKDNGISVVTLFWRSPIGGIVFFLPIDAPPFASVLSPPAVSRIWQSDSVTSDMIVRCWSVECSRLLVFPLALFQNRSSEIANGIVWFRASENVKLLFRIETCFGLYHLVR